MADIRIDTSALTYKNFLILGQTPTPVDGSIGAVLNLSPGTYTFQQPDIDADFLFEVTSEGFVTYITAHDGFLSGRGTSTLVVRGLSITLDATLLSHNLLPTVRESSSLLRDRTHEMHLLPASSYGFYVERGILANFLFGVDANGQVMVDSRFTGFAQANGRTLRILGYQLTIDGRALSHGLKPLVIESFLPRDLTHELTLIPAFGYTFQPAAGIVADFFFDVDVNGQIVIDPRYRSFATVNERSLIISGYQITINGQQLSHDLAVSIWAPNQNLLSRDRTHELTLIPAVGYSFVSASGIAADFQFALNVDGQVVVDPRYGGFATASGRTLIINGYQITIDGRSLSHALLPVSLLGNGDVLSREQTHELTYIPASGYGFQPAAGLVADFRFNLTVDGQLLIDPRFAGFTGVSERTLTIKGYRVTIDGRELSHDLLPLLLGWVAGELSHTSIHELTLIPAVEYLLQATDGTGVFFRLTLDVDGTVSVSPTGGLFAQTQNSIITTTATIAGSPTPVELPAALVNLTDRISFDPSTGWPPQHPPTTTIIDIRPSPVSFTFADWRHFLTIALANTEVKKLVGDAFDWLGCHLLGLRNAESPLQVLVCLRNSVTGRLVDVRISGNMVTAVDTREPWEHPESPAEMAKAIELVRSNPEHAQHITGLEAHAILRVPDDTKSSSYRHRCIHVMFTEPDDPHIEREVCYAALVDLETQTVVAASKMPCSHNNV